MTSGEFITHTDLTLLCNVNLSHLQNTVGKFVANGNGKLTTLHLCIQHLIFLHEVDNQFSYQLILMLIICPVVALDITILKVTQSSSSELATLGDDLGTCIVLDTLRGLAFRQFKELVDQDIAQIIDLCLILFVNLGQGDLILLL